MCHHGVSADWRQLRSFVGYHLYSCWLSHLESWIGQLWEAILPIDPENSSQNYTSDPRSIFRHVAPVYVAGLHIIDTDHSPLFLDDMPAYFDTYCRLLHDGFLQGLFYTLVYQLKASLKYGTQIVTENTTG